MNAGFYFSALASGSEGNALLVRAEQTTLMVDCGLGLRQVEAKIRQRGLEPAQLAGILVTHEHGDHIGGVLRLARKHEIPVYGSYGTLNAVPDLASKLPRLIPIDGHEPLSIGPIQIQPYAVPHDAKEPLQFVFAYQGLRLGLLTDVGHSTPHIRHMLSGLDALILEANHDPELLAQSSYPPSLKRRIAGPYGHLSNAQSQDLLQNLDCSKLQHLVAAHLSQQNNHPELAVQAMALGSGYPEQNIVVAHPELGFDWLSITANPTMPHERAASATTLASVDIHCALPLE